MTLFFVPLPQLDGSWEATTARLDAWVRSASSYDVEDALYGVRRTLEDATEVLADLTPGESCASADCPAYGMKEARGLVGKAWDELRAVENATADLQHQVLGGAA